MLMHLTLGVGCVQVCAHVIRWEVMKVLKKVVLKEVMSNNYVVVIFPVTSTLHVCQMEYHSLVHSARF